MDRVDEAQMRLKLNSLSDSLMSNVDRVDEAQMRLKHGESL